MIWWLYGPYMASVTKNIAPVAHGPRVTTAAPTTLPPGTYTVGADKDIAPGLYGISPGPKQIGNLVLTSAASTYNATMDYGVNVENYGAPTTWAQLATGDKVTLSGAKLKNIIFKAVTTAPSDAPALAKLYPASFTIVSNDPTRANPGKFFIHDDTDKSAYILIIGKNNKIKYNHALNSTGFIVEFADGDYVATVGISKSFFTEPR